MLVTVTAGDYREQSKRFTVIYQLQSFGLKRPNVIWGKISLNMINTWLRPVCWFCTSLQALTEPLYRQTVNISESQQKSFHRDANYLTSYRNWRCDLRAKSFKFTLGCEHLHQRVLQDPDPEIHMCEWFTELRFGRFPPSRLYSETTQTRKLKVKIRRWKRSLNRKVFTCGSWWLLDTCV